MYDCHLDTKIGELLLAGDDDVLCLIAFPEGSMRRDPDPVGFEMGRGEERDA